MRRVFADMMMSLDGYFEGPNKELDWFVWDQDMEKYSIKQMSEIDTVLLGRVTYEFFAGYWPTPKAAQENPRIAPFMNQVEKVIFSKTLDRADWANSRLFKGDIVEEIARLKATPGKDIVAYGGAGLVSSLTRLGLLDELRVRVNPVVLGQGHPLFKDIAEKRSLKLVRTMAFSSGVVTLFYKPV